MNIQVEGALFGQISRPFSPTLTGSIGGRLTVSNSTGYLIDRMTSDTQKSSRNTIRFASTLALDWHPDGAFSAFFHYQQGYRAGGIALAPEGSMSASRNFNSDGLNMNELGIRIGSEASNRLSVRAAIFFADWNNIQADLVDGAGLPYTANIGRGFLYGVDGTVTWWPATSIMLTAATFVNDSRLTRLEAKFVI